MANNSIKTNLGNNVLLFRGYTTNANLSSTLRLAPTKFKVGIINGTPSVSSTDLDRPVPITNGTVNDNGSNTLTGSSGGDNTTDNTVTFKEGAGESDVTAQNLLTNTSSATKVWTIAALTNNMSRTEEAAIFFSITDSAALAKFLTAGTAVELRFGSDTSNYFSKTFTASDLSTGFTFLDTAGVNIEDLPETGTVSGNVDTFVIVITTNNAADTFVAGDVVYDLLRQWATTDLIKSFVSGFPTFDFTNNEVTIKCRISTIEANGFLVNGLGIFNEDTSPLITDEDTFTADSKSGTDEFVFIVTNRVL